MILWPSELTDDGRLMVDPDSRFSEHIEYVLRCESGHDTPLNDSMVVLTSDAVEVV